jgi:hypothetical protein
VTSPPPRVFSLAPVQFEISHDFDIPRDALELAVLSPELVKQLMPRLNGIERVDQRVHTLKNGVLERTWSYQANVKLPRFAERYVTREMCAWDERSTYELARHASSWFIVPHVKPEWRKFFDASGIYELIALGEARTRRIVRGDLELRVPPLFRGVAERMIVGEVRKTFDAEAATIRDLATLG